MKEVRRVVGMWVVGGPVQTVMETQMTTIAYLQLRCCPFIAATTPVPFGAKPTRTVTTAKTDQWRRKTGFVVDCTLMGEEWGVVFVRWRTGATHISNDHANHSTASWRS